MTLRLYTTGQCSAADAVSVKDMPHVLWSHKQETISISRIVKTEDLKLSRTKGKVHLQERSVSYNCYISYGLSSRCASDQMVKLCMKIIYPSISLCEVCSKKSICLSVPCY